MNKAAKQWTDRRRPQWNAGALRENQNRRSLLVIVCVLIGILAIAVLSIGLAQASSAEQAANAAAPVTESELPVDAGAGEETLVDTVLVYDKSGPMEYDTLCYGCWEAAGGQVYPDGDIYPLHWSDTAIASADHCANACVESDYQNYDSTYEHNDCNYRHITHTDRIWIVIEAEEYSQLNTDYHRYTYTPGKTYWVMQHNGQGAYYRAGSIRGAYLAHHPYYVKHDNSLGVSCVQSAVEDGFCNYDVDAGPFAAPRADYDLYAPRAGTNTYYFWIRGQGGQTSDDDHIFWGVDKPAPPGSVGMADGFSRDTGINYDGADPGKWEWRSLGQVSLSQGSHTLNLWAGGAGFDLDRIIVTTYNITPPSTIMDAGPNNGRTNWACAPCDPRFAGRPGGQTSPVYRPDCIIDLRSDDIYDDEQSMRGALEAAKNFVVRIDPSSAQIGYVRYYTSAEIASELQCLQRLGASNCISQTITDTVIHELDVTRAGGATNIAGGIQRGIEVLSASAGHYGRPGATSVMVLMTNGEADSTAGCDPACDDEDLWSNGGAAKDCVVYYAQQARDNDIVIHTISLGWGADRDLMEYVANLTGGDHFSALTVDKLDEIFDDLFIATFMQQYVYLPMVIHNYSP